MTREAQYRAAGYVRLSKSDDRQGNESGSITNQKKIIEDYVNAHEDIRLEGFYADDGFSGSGYERPEFTRMIEAIREGSVDCVIVKDLSRFGREYIGAGMYMERIFPYLGVRLISVTENIDTADSEGGPDLGIMLRNLLHDNYNRELSAKIRSVLRMMRERGEVATGQIPYGYRRTRNSADGLIVDETTAPIVKEIFALYLSGCGVQTIADILNERKVLSPGRYREAIGNRPWIYGDHDDCWIYATVRRILSDEVYIGNLVQGKTVKASFKSKKVLAVPREKWYVRESAHEPIIDRNSFALTQRGLGLDVYTRHGERNINPLSGLLFCADCGNSMRYVRYRGGIKRSNGYICMTNSRFGTCSRHFIREDVLENAVLGVINEHAKAFVAESTMRAPAQVLRGWERQLAADRQELLHVRLDMDRLLELKNIAGSFGEDGEGILAQTCGEKYRHLCVREQRILEDIHVLEEKIDGNRDWMLRLFETRSMDKLDRTVVLACVSRVIVHDKGKVEIVLLSSIPKGND